MEKGEITCTSNFSFSHNVFYSIKESKTEIIIFVTFNLSSATIFSSSFQFGLVQNFVVWEWVKAGGLLIQVVSNTGVIVLSDSHHFPYPGEKASGNIMGKEENATLNDF